MVDKQSFNQSSNSKSKGRCSNTTFEETATRWPQATRGACFIEKKNCIPFAQFGRNESCSQAEVIVREIIKLPCYDPFEHLVQTMSEMAIQKI